MRTTSILLAAIALVFASCSDDTPTLNTAIPFTRADAVATTGPTPTTAMIPTTTTATTPAPATTATTAAPTTTTAGPEYLVDTSDFFPDPLPGSDLAHGSGCVTGADVLGDGVWFGYAEAVAGGVISFDLACFWTGAAAAAEATADGEDVYDFYIRNQNPKTYDVPIAVPADVYWVDPVGVDWPWPSSIPIAGSAWPTASSFLSCPGQGCHVWLYVNSGQATGIVEQYLP